MPSVETSTWIALKEHIEAMPLPPGVAVVFPKENAPHNGRSIWVDWLPNAVARFAINSDGASQRPGILQITVTSPLSSREPAEVDYELAGAILAHFPQDLALDYGNVRVKITRAGDIAPSFRDGGYWRTPVSIYYSVDQ